MKISGIAAIYLLVLWRKHFLKMWKLLTLTGDVVAVVVGEADCESDGPFDAVSSSFSFSKSAAPPFFFLSLAKSEDSRSGNGGISSKTIEQKKGML